MIDIETDRLVLRLVPLAGLAATAAHDGEAARRLIGRNLPDEWFEDAWVFDWRLTQWKENSDYAPWSIRAIALKATGQIVGTINCHDMPRPFAHDDEDGLIVELGYTIFAPWRRQGYALEAINGLSHYAAREGVRWVRLSISPGNAPSLALAEKLGAVRIGTQYDDVDGPEDVFLLGIG